MTVPVVQKVKGGPSRFWGFLAVSMSLPEAFHRAGLEELSSRGYDYSLSVGPSGSGQSTILAARGSGGPTDSVVQAFRVQNLEVRLALRRHGGWLSVPGTLLDITAVLLVSVLVFVFLNVVRGQRESQAALDTARASLAAEVAAREQVKEQLAASRRTEASEATQLQGRLDQAQEEIALHVRDLREATEARQSMDAALKQAQLQAGDLQARLEISERAQEKNRAATEVELADTQSQLKVMREQAMELKSALAKAVQSGDASRTGAQAQEEEWQAAIAELQARLKTQTAASAKAREADAAKLSEAEAAVQELKVQLKDTEGLRARVDELEAQLRAAEANPRPPAEPSSLPRHQIVPAHWMLRCEGQMKKTQERNPNRPHGGVRGAKIRTKSTYSARSFRPHTPQRRWSPCPAALSMNLGQVLHAHHRSWTILHPSPDGPSLVPSPKPRPRRSPPRRRPWFHAGP